MEKDRLVKVRAFKEFTTFKVEYWNLYIWDNKNNLITDFGLHATPKNKKIIKYIYEKLSGEKLDIENIKVEKG